jgi:hypothetical protein
METMDVKDIKQMYFGFGGEWEEINIFGIRCDENPDSDEFNDWIGIATDGFIKVYKGTTDPGLYYTKIAPITYDKVTGAAHLIDGFHKHAWQVGIHMAGTSFAHEALMQTGGPVTIWRDTNKDFSPANEPKQTGYFGINIHRSQIIGDTPHIANYSAGCVVMQNNKDFLEFMNIIKMSETFKKINAKFSLFIINKNWF